MTDDEERLQAWREVVEMRLRPQVSAELMVEGICESVRFVGKNDDGWHFEWEDVFDSNHSATLDEEALREDLRMISGRLVEHEVDKWLVMGGVVDRIAPTIVECDEVWDL